MKVCPIPPGAHHLLPPASSLPCPAAPELLDSLLSHIADQIATYVKYQIDSGADCVMMFDSWGGQLPPMLWDRWSRPYIERIVQQVGLSDWALGGWGTQELCAEGAMWRPGQCWRKQACCTSLASAWLLLPGLPVQALPQCHPHHTPPPLHPQVKATHPNTPLTLYANGSGGLLERMAGTGVDVIGLDWTVDMADARRRLGPNQAVQVRALGGVRQACAGAAAAAQLVSRCRCRRPRAPLRPTTTTLPCLQPLHSLPLP